MDKEEDQRDVELSTLSAIFPEIQPVNDDDPYTFILEIPVNPSKAVTVFFPAATEQGRAELPAAPQSAETAGPNGNANIDSHELAYLPGVCLRISLPPSYPAEKPPVVSITTSPSWLPTATAQKLENECARLWEELGRDLVVFTYVDHIQQFADDVFGLVSEAGALEISPEHKIAVLDHDIKAKRAAFDKETFDCGICLDPKKGAKCHRMLDCGHVFCIQCLQDFYNNAIKEGDLATVRCLTPGCSKEREAAQASAGRKKRKLDMSISPSELLQIPLEPDAVKRYVALKYKTELESDKNTIYCPRPWCQGAARSKRHKKPEGFQLHEGQDSDDDDDDDDKTAAEDSEASKPGPKPWVPEDRLAVCEDCGFAFCSRCRQGWHGDFVICTPDRSKEELSAEEKASLEFISLHTSQCPTCSCPAQKTHGCNHMICFKCQSHFCYLCMAWLDPGNPYQHFNRMPDGRVTSCYMRLWELEGGDENGEYAFAGGRAERQVEAVQPNEEQQPDVVVHHRDIGRRQAERNVRVDRERPAPLNGPVDVAREAPLVLRLDVGQQPAAAPNPVQQQQLQARGQNRGRGNRGGLRQPQRQAQPGLRGRGGGGAAAARGRGDVVAHQRGARGGGGGIARREQQLDRRLQDEVDQDGQLEDRDAEWIRHFVQLALEDNEHLIDEDD